MSPPFVRAALGLILALLITAPLTAAADRIAFGHSILPVPATRPGPVPRQGRLVRAALTSAETAADLTFEVALRMRHFDELQARLARGELVPAAEMQAKYFPLAADHDRVAAWLKSQGFTLVRTDADHLAIFARGSVAQVQQALQVQFARVAVPDGEYTSATTAPSLPADIASAVLGMHGLQPHLHPHRLAHVRSHSAATPDTVVNPPYYPAQIASVYNATGLGLTGSGQTIAIFSEAYPANSDLTEFWSRAGVGNLTANIQTVDINGGPGSPNSDSEAEVEALTEVSLDAEWASALATGATIRIYGSNVTDAGGFDETYQQILADLPTQPNLHVFSISFGQNEDETDNDYFIIQSQYMAALAASGVTVFAASGDGGSNPDPSSGDYNASAPETVNAPADDPNVTGVGGTSMQPTTAGTPSFEVVWSGSGGGASTVFTRPGWQTGNGVPAGTQRMVPDVAAAADPSYGAAVVIEGTFQTVGGTSWATPTWAAFCALLNQARANSGLGPIGPLNPAIYPLNGTSCFRDITQGNNGAYSAGSGYDPCTGLGVPDVTALAETTLAASPASAPTILIPLANAVAVANQPVSLPLGAAGTAPLAYQWQREPAGGTAFSNLPDGGVYSGSATPVLTVSAPTAAMSGDQFRCVVSNSNGSMTSTAGTLTVVAYGVSTLAGWPGAAGAADGTGWNARFNFPDSIVRDSSGNLFVADTSNNVIREVTPAGVVTTFAGAFDSAGGADGQGTAARFNSPAYIAIDGANNLYVADAENYTIREITPSGAVSTIAGQAGDEGTTNGPVASALLYDPEAVTIDASGNIYIADGMGNNILKLSGGVVSTLAGSGRQGSTDGTGTAARFYDPTAIAVDASGMIYVSDSFNNTVRKITPAGVVTTLAGTAGVTGSADGTGSTASFNLTAGLRVDAFGNVFVCDQENATLREITPAGGVTTVTGSAGVTENTDGLPANALFTNPTDITFDPTGKIYLSDGLNNDVRRVDLGPATVLVSPTDPSIAAGQNVSFTATTSGPGPFVTCQWQSEAPGTSSWTNLANGGVYSGVTTPILTITAAPGALDQTQFQCLVNGSLTAAATLTIPGTETITAQPAATALTAGNTATFTVAATGTGSLSYQWFFDGAALSNGGAISGATTSTLTIADAQAAQAGSYTVLITDSTGGVTSGTAALTVTPAVAPAVSSQPASVTLAAGQTASFFVAANGTSPFTYQWSLNGTAISTATDAYLVVSNVSATNAGSYTCAVTNSAGTATSAGATLTLSASADLGRLTNVSVRTNCGTGSANIVAGFVLGGAGNNNTSKSMLIRADGPELAGFGVSDFLPDPNLDVFNTSGSSPVSVGQNTGWCVTQTNENNVIAADNAVYAFPLTTNSASSATVLTLPPDQYTENVTGVSNDTGIALAEVYDVSNASQTYSAVNPRLINVSARANVTTGSGNLIAGFTIGGTTDKTVLVRGTGPGLAEFGLTGLLDQPTLAVYSTSGADTLVATNTGWAEDPVLASVAGSVFAFAQTSSADCSLLVTLPPGTYTANLNSNDGTSGLALVEVYEVP